MREPLQYVVWISVLPVSFLLLSLTCVSAAEVDFEAEILPIFIDHCIDCHGEDEQEASLRIDRRAELLRGGDTGLKAVLPGKPGSSYLVELWQSPTLAENHDRETTIGATVSCLPRSKAPISTP